MDNKYTKELFSNCDIYTKGFTYLLTDKTRSLDKYSKYYQPYYKTKDVEKLIKLYVDESMVNDQFKYFFKHISIYFKLEENKKYNNNDKDFSIISSILTFSKNPIAYVIFLLNKNINNMKLNEYSEILYSEKLSSFYNKHRKKIYLNSNDEKIKPKINDVNYFFKDINNPKLKAHIIDIINNDYCKTNIKAISLIANAYINMTRNKKDESMIEFENQENGKTIIDNPNKTTVVNPDINKIINEYSEKISNTLNNTFNPTYDFILSKYKQYRKLVDELELNDKDCRIVKTVMYILLYLSRKHDYPPCQYMNRIIEADVGWAVGKENNKDPSFFGDSKIAKFFYSYYSYMNAVPNPYKEIINNKVVDEMDEEAIKIYNFFKNNGLKNLGFSTERINDAYEFLIKIRDVIEVLGSPLTINGFSLEGYIQGIVSSIIGSAATILDFSISGTVKTLFYAEVIPLNNKRYSLAQIYNYVNFIKLVLENSSAAYELRMIDKEKFVNQAFDSLGINPVSLQKMGYCAYDENIVSLKEYNFLSDQMYKNKNDVPYTMKEDSKLLYSLIQFGIQKHAFNYGNSQYESTFLYGDLTSVKKILKSLTVQEIAYIFNLYSITPDFIKKELANLKVNSINDSLLAIDKAHDHHSVLMYKDFLKSQETLLSYQEEFIGVDYQQIINYMLNEYKIAMMFNKTKLQEFVFDNNEVSGVDDFFIRFVPSIVEVSKLLGYTEGNLETVTKILDSFLKLISDTLFRDIFISAKMKLHDLLSRNTENMLKVVAESGLKFGWDEEVVLDLGAQSAKFTKTLNSIINTIDKKGLNLNIFANCFESPVESEEVYEDMFYDDLIYNYGHSSISRTEFFTGWDEWEPNKDYDLNLKPSKNQKKSKIIKTIPDPKNDSNNDDTISVFYKDGQIIMSKDGQEKILVPKDATIDLFYNSSNINKDDVNKALDKANLENQFKNNFNINEGNNNIELNLKDNNLSELIYHFKNQPFEEIDITYNEYEHLLKVRDLLDSLLYKDLLEINKKLAKEKSNFQKELKKTSPRYDKIQECNYKISQLEQQINEIKERNKNHSDNEKEILIIDFRYSDDNSSDVYNKNDESKYKEHSKNISKYFEDKEQLLSEMTKAVGDIGTPLTSEQISELLK